MSSAFGSLFNAGGAPWQCACTMQARAIPCPRCGGIFPVHSVSAALDCPFCAHRFALGSEAVAELERYQASVHAALGRADAEHLKAAQWTASAVSMRSSWIGLAVFGVLVVLLIASSFVLQALLTRGLIPKDIMPVLSSAMVLGVVLLTVGVSSVVAVRARRSADKASAGKTRVACPSCGAPNELAAGGTLETCRYCRAALLPSHTVMRHAVDAARIAERAAQIQRHRAERQGMAAALGRTTSNATPYIVFGSFLPMTCGATLVMLADLLTADRPPPLAAVASIAALASFNIALLTGVYVWRKLKKQRFQLALTDLARQFHGQRLNDLHDVVAWLNAYWASRYDIHHLSAGPYHSAARIDAGGYAALIDVDPVSSMPRYYPHRVHIVLAAAVPDQALRAPSPAAQTSRHWLERAGFAVSIEPSGLLARAEGATLSHLRKNPDAIHVLATVVTTLAGLAHGLGAEPVDPLP